MLTYLIPSVIYILIGIWIGLIFRLSLILPLWALECSGWIMFIYIQKWDSCFLFTFLRISFLFSITVLIFIHTYNVQIFLTSHVHQHILYYLLIMVILILEKWYSHYLPAIYCMTKSAEQCLMYLLPFKCLPLKNIYSNHFIDFNFNFWICNVYMCICILYVCKCTSVKVHIQMYEHICGGD